MIHALKDKVYRAMEDFNKEQDGGYKYHVVGGAAGTVSPSELHNIFYLWSSFPNPDSFSSFTYIIKQWDGRGKVVSRELPEPVSTVCVYLLASSCMRSHQRER